MLTSTILAITALAGSAAAHYKLLEPTWRGDSFEEPASQWIFPCMRLLPGTSFHLHNFPSLHHFSQQTETPDGFTDLM